MINPKRLNSLGTVIASIGELPSSYIESMSYQEQLYYFYNFLEKTVIPTVDNNAQGLEELQNLYLELKNYVDSYFDNVDFQEKVDTKINEMVENGTLESLINQDLFTNLNRKLNRVIYTKSKFAERIIEGLDSTILFTGDSLTYGQVPSSNEQVENPFPKLIQDFVNNWYSNNTLLTCLNYGVRGAYATNAVNNFDTYLLQNPDTIVWSYGTNDVKNGVSNDSIISSLESFYTSCINNNIELIVIIPPTNFISVYRNQGMRRYHDALLNFCKSRGIIYVDMYSYMNNYYSSLSSTHSELQTDGTHFINYNCFSDCFLSTLLPIIYTQDKAKKYNYIQIDSTPNYVHTSGTPGAITGGIDPFYKGIVFRTATGNTFEMNFLVTKPSYLIINGFANNNGGIATFTIDTNDYDVNQNSTGTGATSLNNKYDYKFPVLLNVGLHKISLKSITFNENQSRVYLFGFTLVESDVSISNSGYIKAEEKYLAWSGNETVLTDELLSLPLNKYNVMRILLGTGGNSFSTIDIASSILTRNFFENTTYKAVVCFGTDIGILSIGIDYTNNQINISSSINIPIRKIWLISSN